MPPRAAVNVALLVGSTPSDMVATTTSTFFSTYLSPGKYSRSHPSPHLYTRLCPLRTVGERKRLRAVCSSLVVESSVCDDDDVDRRSSN